MGIKHTREYEDIIEELTNAILQISNFYEFFEMAEEDWNSMEYEERKDCAKTLADDIFYALNEEPFINVGSGVIAYDKSNNNIKVNNVITIPL